MKDRSIIPNIKKIIDIPIPQVQRCSLANIPCSIITGSSQPLIKFDLSISAGEAYNDNPLVSLFTNALLIESTHKHSATEIAEMIDFLGAEIVPSNGIIYSNLTMICLSKHFNKAWDILLELISSPKFDENDFNTLKANKRKQFQIELNNVNQLSRRFFKQLIFGNDHPYGRLYELNDFDIITTKQLNEHYRRLYHKDNARIFISGDVMEEHLKYIENSIYFSNSTNTLPFIPKLNPNTSQKLFIKKENAVQSAIRIGKLTISKHHPDFNALQIAITLLGGYFGSRLMQELRERRGYTYGIGAFIISLKETGYIVITTEVASKHTQNALNAIYEVIHQFCSEKVSNEELEQARSYLMGEFLRTFDGCFNIMEAYKSLDDLNLGMEHFEQYLNHLKTISPEEILSIAQRYLKEGYSEVIVGNFC
ncbi:MAG: insulinase family protein [Bacteroidales bacterium]|nr:insulinase family protein [Bacteroidales bacterium]